MSKNIERPKRQIDMIDVMLASNRQLVIAKMYGNGQIDAQTACELFKMSTRPDFVEEDRKALDAGKEFDENTAFGRLAGLYFRLAKRQYDPNGFKD